MKKTSANNSKSKDKNDYIDNPNHYFNKVIRNMDNKEYKKLKIVHNTEISIEFNDFDEQIISSQTTTAEIENQLNSNNSLTWVEFLENKKLYYAIKKLKVNELILLHMWINQKYTQKEIAQHMNMEEKTVNKKLVRIRKHLRKKLEEK